MSMPAVGAGAPWCDIHLLQTEGGEQGGANLGRQKAGEQKEGYRRSMKERYLWEYLSSSLHSSMMKTLSLIIYN